MALLRSTLTALMIAAPALTAAPALAAPAVPAVSKSAPQIRACNAAFRENAYTQGFAAARGLYSECLEVKATEARPAKSQAKMHKTFLRKPPSAQSDKKSCHSFSMGSPTRVCLTTALAH